MVRCGSCGQTWTHNYPRMLPHFPALGLAGVARCPIAQQPLPPD
ncbi:MAG: hypothetical protein K0U64_00940 [Actinomycetia bacterium]|nr:hypothetical protein [Actinomycetes bacterium]